MSKQSLEDFINEINGEAMRVKSDYIVKNDTTDVLSYRMKVSSPDLNISVCVGYCPRKEVNTQMAKDMLDFIVDKLKNQYITEATNEVI